MAILATLRQRPINRVLPVIVALPDGMTAVTGEIAVRAAEDEPAAPSVIEPGRRPKRLQDVTTLAIASVGPLRELVAVKRTVAITAMVVPGIQRHGAQVAPGRPQRARQRRRVERRVALPAGDGEMGALELECEGPVPLRAHRRGAEVTRVVAG